MAASADVRRPEKLALLFQEVLTAIVRLRGNRQGVSDAPTFRSQTRRALETASAQALATGYAGDDVKQATFAVVAFLDESVLNSLNPIFTDWLRKPLQEELFGTHVAGELFFRNLQQMMVRSDAPDLADLLEVYYLCLLLGFGGRYSGARGELAQAARATGEKIARIRGGTGPMSPAWALPPETAPSQRDPWVRRLGLAAIASAAVMVLLFVIYQVVLAGGTRSGL